jgi:hypothetical protein
MYDQSYPSTPTQNPAGYAPMPAGAPEPQRRRTGAFVAIGAIVALLLLAGGVALFGPFRSASSVEASANALPSSRTAPVAVDADDSPTSIDVPVLDEAPTTVDPSVPTGGGQAPTGNGGGGGSTSGGGSGGGAPAPQAPSAPAPVITSFSTPESIDCHNGNSQTFTASWSTTNATKVTISIDGPGVYKTYGPTGSDSLPFNCSTPHTFLLTAYGHDGSTVSKSITLQPRNVQVPDSGDEDPSASVSTPDDEI